MRSDDRETARRLRSEGKSIREIAKLIGASKGSVSPWVRDVALTPEQRSVLDEKSGKIGLASKRFVDKRRRERLGYQEEGREKAKGQDPSHQAMCMLYWAEGTKNRNSCRMTNSDARMMAYFVSLLRRYFGLSPSDFKVCFNVHTDNGLSLAEIEDWWLRELGLPRSSLRKSTVDRRQASGKKGRKNRLHHGVCTVSVDNTRIVQHIFGAIQEYVGFNDPTWLYKRTNATRICT